MDDLGSNTAGLLPRLARIVGIGAVAYFGYRWYTVRMKFRKLKADGIPMMPHSMLWGHLGIVRDMVSNHMPSDVYLHHIQWCVIKNWQTLFPNEEKCPDVIYMDFWPLSVPPVMVIDPEIASQYMQHPSAPKFELARKFIHPMTKNLDLITMEGEQWKKWRARFNPGFSGKNLLSQLPDVLGEVQIFVDIIKSKAGKDGGWGEAFQFEGHAINLTFDVIGRFALGVNFEAQRGQAPGVKEALTEIINLLVFDTNIITIWQILNPKRRYKLWQNHQVMDSFLLPHIEKELRRPKDEGYGSYRTILELAVNNAKEELLEGGTDKLDYRFVETVLAQLKAFLFAGHDTTATSMCWALHLLQKHPDALKKLRREHDEVFGKDTQMAAQMLGENPALINALPYTQGVVKEALRLYPNIASARQGSPALNLKGVSGYAGKVFPTDGFMIWDGLLAMHMREDFWVQAAEFVPERWIVKEDDPLHPPKNAFRTFSIGPRNCIGKDLAMIEMKLALVMLAREVDVEEAWEEWDIKTGRTGEPVTYNGDRLYQVMGTTPHPKAGMPVHVRLR